MFNRNIDFNKIVKLWIKRYQDGSDEENQWAYDTLDDLCSNNSELALKVIFSIYESTQNEEVIDNLAAGPLEDLLVRNGVQVIGSIEKYTKGNPQFADVLSGVWPSSISTDVLEKISTLISEFSTLDE